MDVLELMRGKKIKDELRIRNGVHNWEYWHADTHPTLNRDKG